MLIIHQDAQVEQTIGSNKEAPSGMKNLVITSLCFLTLAWSTASRSDQAQPSTQTQRKAQLAPCANRKDGALCGKYEVFEDREAKSGRKIALNIVVLPALSSTPAPDPVFLLAGGPGQGAATVAKSAGENFMRDIRRERDIVFVDQRGTGDSNRLDCDLSGNDDRLQSYFGEMFPAEKVRECRKQLEKIADLRLYTTSIAMDDLDEVREAMGYERINLLGGSYGTMAAMEYVRRHADHTRSAALRGVATPAMKMPLHFIRGAQMGMDRLMEDCAADPSCSAVFPNFRKEFAAVLARFDKGPVSFELVNPSTQKPEQVSMSRGFFVEQVRLMLYNLQSARRIPLLIHQIYQDGFASFGETIISGDKGFGLPIGMYLTVTCSETTLLITEKEIIQQTAGTFMEDYRVRVHVRACQEWPRGKVPANYTDPIKSDVPVLMLSGELDTATPPQLGEAIVQHLPNGRQLRIRYRSHDYNSACENKLVAEFFSKGTAKGLDASCTDQLRRPPFAIKPR